VLDDPDFFPPIDDGDAPPEGWGDESDAPVSLAELNEPQAEAAAHVDGPLVVFAGAGSGKTRVITYRIANLVAVHRVPPYRVLAVTFTNKAAGEMKKRLETLIGPELVRDLWVGTFHAVSARLLRRYHDAAGLGRSFLIYDDSDQKSVMNRVYKELGIDDKRYPMRQVLGRIHKEKQEGVTAEDFVPGNYAEDTILRCFVAYQKRLDEANAVDFDDLLLKILRLVEAKGTPVGDELRRRFSHVLVDEFQDVNRVQYRIVRALSAEQRNLCVVGDDDQSIYRWRGADVRIVRNFRTDHPDAQIVKLEQNYRSSGNVVAAALGVIKPAKDREPKDLWTENPPGLPVRVVATASERDEAAFVVGRVRELVDGGVSPGEIAIFYRIHAQSRVLEEVMRSERIAYQIVGGMRFFERAEVKDLLSYLRLLENPRSDVDFSRIVNVPPRKIGDTTVDKLLRAASASGSGLLDAIPALVRSSELGPQPKKALARFHALVAELRSHAETASPSEIAEEVLELTGYRRMLEEDESAEAEGRLLNLEELVGSIREFEAEVAAAGEIATLAGYLERITLSASVDEMKEAPRVVLMTVHAAKGLEFSHVFCTGMEEDMFPFRSQDPGREGDLEEERRLAYVALTRAREELVLTWAERRAIFGTTRFGSASRFIADLPREVYVEEKTETLKAAAGRFIDRDGWAYRGDGGARTERPRLQWSSAPRGEPMRPARPAPPATPLPGERFVERDEHAPGHDEEGSSSLRRRAPMREGRAPGELAVGSKVEHVTFGPGVVQSIDEGDDPTATVRFVGWGPKRIKARFLAAKG
jgi:DNA helicase-2/ATP-dependent DNA helicase PcrA